MKDVSVKGLGGEELEKSWRGNKREVRPGGK